VRDLSIATDRSVGIFRLCPEALGSHCCAAERNNGCLTARRIRLIRLIQKAEPVPPIFSQTASDETKHD